MPVRPSDAIEEHVAVARLADGARRHRPDVGDAVAVHDVAEPVERRERRIHGLRADDAARKRVAAEQDAARGLLDDAKVALGVDLGDDQPDCARAHVEHANESVCGLNSSTMPSVGSRSMLPEAAVGHPETARAFLETLHHCCGAVMPVDSGEGSLLVVNRRSLRRRPAGGLSGYWGLPSGRLVSTCS